MMVNLLSYSPWANFSEKWQFYTFLKNSQQEVAKFSLGVTFRKIWGKAYFSFSINKFGKQFCEQRSRSKGKMRKHTVNSRNSFLDHFKSFLINPWPQQTYCSALITKDTSNSSLWHLNLFIYHQLLLKKIRMFGCKLSIICSQQKRQLVAVLLDAHCYLVEAFYMETFFFSFFSFWQRDD